ncbi:hypothetical protein CROQUDRAFT_177993 [Cronartium quercuum f. sp. fusiforme G11]|uniref:Uncharacterized protein n=1 Tax=Cronartium quercuum f. sp. fusiforme G11 TaxID=708437 RepID=A0A9P6THA3_9BASI|nr:hypothetical protein CROQUDRAFT_177993 [Cronartium quercuum f. sp. fusiforme G11]
MKSFSYSSLLLLTVMLTHMQKVRSGTLSHHVKGNTTAGTPKFSYSCSRGGTILTGANVHDPTCSKGTLTCDPKTNTPKCLGATVLPKSNMCDGKALYCSDPQSKSTITYSCDAKGSALSPQPVVTCANGPVTCSGENSGSTDFTGTPACSNNTDMSVNTNPCQGKPLLCKTEGGKQGGNDQEFDLSCTLGSNLISNAKKPTCKTGNAVCDGATGFLTGKLKCPDPNDTPVFQPCGSKPTFCSLKPEFEVSCKKDGPGLENPVLECQSSGNSVEQPICEGGKASDKDFEGQLKCKEGTVTVKDSSKNDLCPSGSTPVCRPKATTSTETSGNFKLSCASQGVTIIPGVEASCTNPNVQPTCPTSGSLQCTQGSPTYKDNKGNSVTPCSTGDVKCTPSTT